MEKFWKRLSDKKDINLESYLKEWISKNSEYKIYIGCDSQNYSELTIYATVIVLHYNSGGAHVIYNKTSLPRLKTKKINDELFNRLWREVEYSIETAGLIMSFGIPKPNYIDIDLNPDPLYRSNTLLRNAVGLIESMGLEFRHKNKSPWAISIADSICNPKKSKHNKIKKIIN